MEQVLAFSTRVHNIGCAPFVIGVPNGTTQGCAHGMCASARCICASSVCMCMCMFYFSSFYDSWSWHDCHQHWHYDNYAHYALRDLCTDKDVAWKDRPVVGHKNGWCVARLSLNSPDAMRPDPDLISSVKAPARPRP